MRDCDKVLFYIVCKGYPIPMYFDFSDLWSNLESGFLKNSCNDNLQKLEEGVLYSNPFIIASGNNCQKSTQECEKEPELDIV